MPAELKQHYLLFGIPHGVIECLLGQHRHVASIEYLEECGMEVASAERLRQLRDIAKDTTTVGDFQYWLNLVVDEMQFPSEEDFF